MLKKVNSNFMKKVMPYAGLIALILIFSLTTQGRFVAARNLTNIIGQSMVTMIAACGCIFVMAHNNLDFSFGGG